MHEHVTDVYVRRAQQDGYRSRSAYKLLEILAKDKLVRPGMTVVDLGAAPGGWSQVLRTGRGPARGSHCAGPAGNGASARRDLHSRRFLRTKRRCNGWKTHLKERSVDLVVSDMAPNMSGVGMVDQARSMHLAELALDFARERLKPGGDLLVKVFQGSGLDEFRQALSGGFGTVAVRKPKASRDRSSEVYLLARGKRQQP